MACVWDTWRVELIVLGINLTMSISLPMVMGLPFLEMIKMWNWVIFLKCCQAELFFKTQQPGFSWSCLLTLFLSFHKGMQTYRCQRCQKTQLFEKNQKSSYFMISFHFKCQQLSVWLSNKTYCGLELLLICSLCLQLCVLLSSHLEMYPEPKVMAALRNPSV